MDSERAAEELKIIRQLMERPIRLSTMSGLSGILAGCIALAGLAADAFVCQRCERLDQMLINMSVWACVFLVTASSVLGLTRLRELRKGMPFWTPIKKRILVTILPPFVAGAGLTLAIVFRWWQIVFEHVAMPNQFGLIPPIWMICYGLACWQVGDLSIKALRVMGAAFILTGIVVAAFFQYSIAGLAPGLAPYWTLGITFGGFHIVYGLYVWAKYGG